MVTLFLTCNTIIQNVFGWTVTDKHTTESTFEKIKFGIAGAISVVVMLALFTLTTLGSQVKKSFKKRPAQSLSKQNKEQIELNA